MPVIGALTGGLDFSNYFIPLSRNITADSLGEARKQGAVLAYGNFITVVLNFLIIAWALFIAIKAINRLPGRVSNVRHPVRETGQLLGDAGAMVELGACRPRLPVGLHGLHHRAVAVGLGRAAAPAPGRKNDSK